MTIVTKGSVTGSVLIESKDNDRAGGICQMQKKGRWNADRPHGNQ